MATISSAQNGSTIICMLLYNHMVSTENAPKEKFKSQRHIQEDNRKYTYNWKLIKTLYVNNHKNI
jgi:hypothetical protein